MRFPGRKLAYAANLKEEYVGLLPVGRSRFKTRIREIEKLVNRAELASENTSLRTKAGNNT